MSDGVGWGLAATVAARPAQFLERLLDVSCGITVSLDLSDDSPLAPRERVHDSASGCPPALGWVGFIIEEPGASFGHFGEDDHPQLNLSGVTQLGHK